MKNKWTVPALILSVALLVTGCSKPATTETAKAADQPVTLTVWESTGGPDDFIKQAAEAYKAVKPNVSINFVNVELGDTSSQIALDGPAGAGADLFAAPHDKLGELVTGGHILPTANTDLVNQSAIQSSVSALTYNDKLYGYPISAETYALFYNKNLIKEDEVPKTWDELKAWSKKFNAENPKKHGFMMDVANGYYTIIFTTNNNNKLFGASGTDAEHTNINTPDAVEGMKTFAGLKEILNYQAADLNTAFCDGAFASGDVAMYITGLWNVKNFKDAGIDFGVSALPALKEGANPVSSFSGTRAMFVSAYSKHPEEANDFAAFLMSEDMQKLRFELTGALPSIDMTVDSPYIKGFLDQLQYAFPMPSIPEMSKYWDSMNAASSNIWNGSDIQKELDAVDAAMKQK